jgi:3-hydroxyisobutyrate dehydrogenase-like beta-hydroxyacid dehydrogenase
MRIAVIGLGRMGRALAERLLEEGHQVSVWNRTPGRAGALQEQGAQVMDSADEVGDECDAVFLCLADDRSTLDVAAPKGQARTSWEQTLVVNTGTVAPDVLTALAHVYGERFVDAQIIGAPQALRSGAAKFIVGGPASGRAALLPLWKAFAGALDVGEDPQTAAVIKLLNNQMLLVQLAVIAETVRAGRAAGVDDATLAATLRESAMMPAGLRNRIDVLFDPRPRRLVQHRAGRQGCGALLGPRQGQRGAAAGHRGRARRLPAGGSGWVGDARRHRPGRVRPALAATGAIARSADPGQPFGFRRGSSLLSHTKGSLTESSVRPRSGI